MTRAFWASGRAFLRLQKAPVFTLWDLTQLTQAGYLVGMEQQVFNAGMEFRLRNIPDAVWKEFKILCLREDTNPNTKLNQMLNDLIVKKGKPK
jgi:hypothetical protein